MHFSLQAPSRLELSAGLIFDTASITKMQIKQSKRLHLAKQSVTYTPGQTVKLDGSTVVYMNPGQSIFSRILYLILPSGVPHAL